MGLIKEITYFNCFLAKKVVEDNGSSAELEKLPGLRLPWEPYWIP